DMVHWLKCRLTSQPLPQITPWYKDFRGTISIYEKEIKPEKIVSVNTTSETTEEENMPANEEEIRDVNMGDVLVTPEGKIIRKTMLVQGTYNIKEGRGKSVVFTISEIPIGVYFEQYKAHLDGLEEKKIISN